MDEVPGRRALWRSGRAWIVLAGVNGFMAVSAGAFAAHGVTDPPVRALLQTGAQYQAIHAAAALACQGVLTRAPVLSAFAGALFGLGALVFGGSLYLLAITGAGPWGAVTPLGGLALLAGWTVVIVAGVERSR